MKGPAALRPYEGIVPDEGVVLADPEERRQEVFAQAAANTQDHHLTIDHGYLLLAYDGEHSLRQFEPTAQLSMAALSELMY